MKVIIKEITDPPSNEKNNKTGIINVIDLANIDTCSFIATEDFRGYTMTVLLKCWVGWTIAI